MQCLALLEGTGHACKPLWSTAWSQAEVVRVQTMGSCTLRGARPPPPVDAPPDVPLFAALHNDRMRLYRDTSGDSLHRRGYRDAMHVASLNEAAAAGALQLAKWPDIVRDSRRRGDSASAASRHVL